MKTTQSQELTRIMVVSKAGDQNDYSQWFREIDRLCNAHDCQLLCYSLSSFHDGGRQWPVPRRLLMPPKSKSQLTLLESCSWEGEGHPFWVQVFTKQKKRPDFFYRKVAKSSDPDTAKIALVKEIKARTYSNFKNKRVTVLVCGEISNLTVSHDGKKRVRDSFGLEKAIAAEKADIILNPWHTYGRRFEHNVKRKYLSRNKRIYLSVWNQKSTAGKGEPKCPWIAFKGGRNITAKFKELPKPIAARPDIRIATLEV